MKRLTKLLTNLLAVLLLVAGCTAMVGCGDDITTTEVKIQLYDYASQEFYGEDEATLTIDLYGHLAPRTVEAIASYINEGYYNNALIYSTKVDSIEQIMVGDLYVDGDAIVVGEDGVTNIKQKAVKPTLPGEFENGGTTGSNLKNTKGSVGLWRSWYATGNFETSSATNTGSATWFMPSKARTSYDDNFCVFGQIDLEQEVNSSTYNALTSLFETKANYTEYVIYYTYSLVKVNETSYALGEYDATKPNANLVFNCVTKEYFNENISNLTEEEIDEMSVEDQAKFKVFEADDEKLELVCYNKMTIKVANNASGKVGAMIKSATIK